jgi:AcrR family transcriptional regulator
MYVKFMNQIKANLNDERSRQTQARLIDATNSALIDLGFSRTTGVEICRRAGLTRGALNHHFADLADLYVAALHSVYERLTGSDDGTSSDLKTLEQLVQRSYQRITQPEFKVVIELWLASRNDPDFGSRLAAAIAEGASMFSPEALLASPGLERNSEIARTYRMIVEALIGLGLGRVVNEGKAVAHEGEVVAMLMQLARNADVSSN